MTQFRKLGISLVVGAVGHRDLTDPVKVAEIVAHRIAEIRDRWPNIPIIAMSSLAEGADRIFARLALGAGWELHVPLPMERADYSRDFEDRSLAEFNDLCARATEIYQVPPLAPASTEVPRRVSYAAAATFIACHCHILFAVWNGDVESKVGGTTHTLSCRLSGEVVWAPAVYPPNKFSFSSIERVSRDKTETLCVIVPAERISAPGTHSNVDGWITGPKLPLPHETNTRLKQVAGLDTLDLLAQRSVELGYVSVDDRNAFGELLGRADQIATEYVPYMRRSWYFVLSLFGLALIASGVYGDLPIAPYPKFWLLAYFLLLSATAVVSWASLARERRKDSAGWRTFAEVLRVLEAWHLAGVGTTTTDWANPANPNERIRTGWVAAAARGLARGYLPFEPTEHAFRDLAAVRASWIEGQIGYFRQRGVRIARLQVIRRVAMVTFALGIAAAAYVLADEFVGLGSATIRSLMWFAAGILPNLSALTISYCELAELSGTGTNSDEILECYLELAGKIDKLLASERLGSEDCAEVKELVLQLGTKAISETSGWHVSTSRAAKLAQGYPWQS